ncbi:hypothetical protein DXN05_14810 [Deminuibacter soli]|uniref:Uncharacterized protein n=1 Tax=Deminuibacter soli TaxID=2291815 RepID=A0A3E1NH59_9BACT|nr:hypothetical protein DXN05_14810 [Deminuibacter soli]
MTCLQAACFSTGTLTYHKTQCYHIRSRTGKQPETCSQRAFICTYSYVTQKGYKKQVPPIFTKHACTLRYTLTPDIL